MMSSCIYDIKASWADNIAKGPSFDGPVPDRQLPPPHRWIEFLGHKVASPLGVPAGPLLDSRWTTLAGRLGFDIVTYKTIRTQASCGYPPPNVLYLQPQQQLDAVDDGVLLQSGGQDIDMPVSDIGITNSFGMPSTTQEFLKHDIPTAQAALGPGQVLVVSVTGTPSRADGVSFIDDFVEAALFAKQAGATIVEANYSCPNVSKGQGALYTDPVQVSLLSQVLVAALGPEVPLIIKVGACVDNHQLEAVLVAAAASGVRGVSGINGLSRHIVNADGSPALGPDRPTSGACGAPIRHAALEFVQAARDIINQRDLNLTLVGVGGVTTAQHVVDMLSAGADVVQSATGMMWNPLLACEYHQLAEISRTLEH